MVRVGFPGGPRLEWYDRNPSTQLLWYGGAGIAPHGLIARATYTVPTGKKAFLEYGIVVAIRATAPTTAGRVTTQITITPSGGSAAGFLVIRWTSAVLDYHESMNVGNAGALAAGDMIQVMTADLSTGGTLDYSAGVKLTEFSA